MRGRPGGALSAVRSRWRAPRARALSTAGAIDQIAAGQDVGRVGRSRRGCAGPRDRRARPARSICSAWAASQRGRSPRRAWRRARGSPRRRGRAARRSCADSRVKSRGQVAARSRAPRSGSCVAAMREMRRRAAPRPPPCRRRSDPWAPRAASAGSGRAAAAVERRLPGEAVEAPGQPLDQRRAAVVAGPDQPLARLDLASRPSGPPRVRGGSPPAGSAILAA